MEDKVPTFEEHINEAKNPYFFIGKNPTVDLIVFRNTKHAREVLLIRRAKNAAAEQGKWALPGGFHDTNAKKGEEWKPGKETKLSAALRELAEETGLTVTKYKSKIKYVGEYKDSGRDPRDNKISWSESTAFTVMINKEDGNNVKGLDDADMAEWLDIKDVLKMNLAFDHKKIIKDALLIV